MTLTQALTNYRENARAHRSQDVLTVMQQATQALEQSGIADQALSVGETIPDVTLPNATGDRIALSQLLAQGPLVISFYRGGWCPYCNLELRALQQALPDIEALGAQLVAISPETPDSSLSTQEKNALSFQVLSDQGNQVANAFGLVFTLPQSLRPLYDGFGIDIPAHNGDTTFQLPLPATYVVDSDGIILHAFVQADYTQRMDPQDIITALNAR